MPRLRAVTPACQSTRTADRHFGVQARVCPWMLAQKGRSLASGGNAEKCASADALLRQGFEGLSSKALAKEDVTKWASPKADNPPKPWRRRVYLGATPACRNARLPKYSYGGQALRRAGTGKPVEECDRNCFGGFRPTMLPWKADDPPKPWRRRVYPDTTRMRVGLHNKTGGEL